MGCPYNARFVFGIQITKEQYNNLNGLMEDDDYFKMNYDFDRNEGHYIDLDDSYNVVSNCSIVEELSLDTLQLAQKKAVERFKESKLLQENFKESDIKGLLICEYVG